MKRWKVMLNARAILGGMSIKKETKTKSFFGIIFALALLFGPLMGAVGVFATNEYNIEYSGGSDLGPSNVKINDNLLEGLASLAGNNRDLDQDYLGDGWSTGYYVDASGGCYPTYWYPAVDDGSHEIEFTNGELDYRLTSDTYIIDVSIKKIVFDGVNFDNPGSDALAVYLGPSTGSINARSMIYNSYTCGQYDKEYNVVNNNSALGGTLFIEANIKVTDEDGNSVRLQQGDDLFFGITDIDAGQSYKILNDNNLLNGDVSPNGAGNMYALSDSVLQPNFVKDRNKFVSNGNYIYSEGDFNIKSDSDLYVKINGPLDMGGSDGNDTGLNAVFGYRYSAGSGVYFYTKQYNVKYTTDGGGYISGDKSEKVLPGHNPLANVTTSPASTSGYYKFKGWIADVDVMIDGEAEARSAGTILTIEEIKDVIVNQDITFTATYSSALSYQNGLDIQFEFEPVLSITLSANDLLIDNLMPGNADYSNTISVDVATNDLFGYTLNASVGDGVNYTNNSLVNTANVGTPFSSLATSDDLMLNEFQNNQWGYTLASNIGNSTTYTGLAYNSDITINMTKDLAGTADGEYLGGNSTDFTIGAKASSDQVSGDYKNIINFTAVGNVAPPPMSINDIEYLQDFATLSAEDRASVIASMEPNVNYPIKDNRDDPEYATIYTIAKIQRSRYEQIWMTTNLNLAGGTTLTYEDTDIPEGYVLPTDNGFGANNTLPESSMYGFNDNNYASVYNSDEDACDENQPCYSYYSWTAATAGSGVDLVGGSDVDGVDTPYSICPAGWKLPTSGKDGYMSTDYDPTSPTYGEQYYYSDPVTGYKKGDFYKLGTAYGVNLEEGTSASFDNAYAGLGPGTSANFVLNGSINDSSLYNAGYNGNYWSATSGYAGSGDYDSKYAYGFSLEQHDMNVSSSLYRYYGQAIRCITSTSTATIVFNANGGTNGEGQTRRTVTVGETVGDMPTPTREGYAFDGWYTELTSGVVVSSNTIVQADATYYAHWIRKLYMQDVAEWRDDLLTGTQVKVYDKRDEKQYYVAKQADGKIWMTQNLDLCIGSYLGCNTVTLTSENTNLNVFGDGLYASGYTKNGGTGVITWSPDSSLDTSRDLDATNSYQVNNWNSDITIPRVAGAYGIIVYTSGSLGDDTIYNNIEACMSDGYMESDCKHYLVGSYYNWTAAVASNNSSSANSTSGYYRDAENSICPANWRLPRGRGDEATANNAEFANLLERSTIISSITSNEYSSNGFNLMRSYPMYFVRGGVVNGRQSYTGTWDNAGQYGYYWSSTMVPYQNYGSYDLVYNARFGSNIVMSESEENTSNRYNVYDRSGAASVRCITSSASATITFNANGGTINGESTYDKTISTGFMIGDAISTPVRSGYEFDGWYTGVSGGTKLESTTIATTDVTYYANWRQMYSMQTVNTWKDSLAVGVQTRVYDERDNSIYYVAKQADGKIWMTQNLDLCIGCSGTATLTSENTDLNVSGTGAYTNGYSTDSNTNIITWTPSNVNSYNIVKYSSTSYNVPSYYKSETYPRVVEDDGRYISPNSGTVYETASECMDGENMSESECGHYRMGNYYNWTAAIASNYSGGKTSEYDYNNAENSICPYGWRLPKRSDSGNTSSNNEFSGLLSQSNVVTSSGDGWLNYTTDGLQLLKNNPLYFTFGGYIYSSGGSYNNSYISGLGSSGNYWTSTYAYYAKLLHFDGSDVNTDGGDSPESAFLVRCVAR